MDSHLEKIPLLGKWYTTQAIHINNEIMLIAYFSRKSVSSALQNANKIQLKQWPLETNDSQLIWKFWACWSM